jgi:hypothetical protein
MKNPEKINYTDIVKVDSCGSDKIDIVSIFEFKYDDNNDNNDNTIHKPKIIDRCIFNITT